MRRFWGYAAATLAALVMGCGGGSDGNTGSGDGSNSTTPQSPELDARLYNGHYVSECSAVPDGSNYETGSPLYAKLVFTVALQTESSVASLSGRFDFYDDNACTGTALGAVSYNVGSSHLYLVSEKSIAGGAAHKVILELMTSGNVSYSAGPTSDTVLLGSVLRLKIPRILATGFYTSDLWRLKDDNLYDGDETAYDNEGFPVSLSSTVWAKRVPSLPSAPEEPCVGATALGWSSTSNFCHSSTVPTASGRSIALTYSFGGISGATTAICQNGSWSVQAGGTCSTSYVPVTCPAQTINWTSGANTCSGSVSLTGAGNTVSVTNTTPGLQGGQIMNCQSNGTWAPIVAGICNTPPPPITDPMQLAQAKNCLACHAVTGTGYSVGFPSFERIAERYRNSPPAPGVLESRVKSGSNSGVYGSFPMPANPQASDSDLAILIPWILSQPQ
ncbi:c-type cytochrome [Hylemonella sp. W303a]|uniref:c-type cytochrome n=1 Tax=Hylemonella sp. W303a TaxID=3389873 RepID=UPI00396B19B2